MFTPRIATAAAVCLAAALFAGCSSSSPEADGSKSGNTGEPRPGLRDGGRGAGSPHPDVRLAPEQVVRLQLEAFRGSASDKEDFDVALRFFVPQMTAPGSREALTRRLRREDYATLFDFTNAEYGIVEVDGDRAKQVVLLENDSNRVELFLFLLKRQTGQPHEDCWLTEIIVPDQLDLRLPLAESSGTEA